MLRLLPPLHMLDVPILLNLLRVLHLLLPLSCRAPSVCCIYLLLLLHMLDVLILLNLLRILHLLDVLPLSYHAPSVCCIYCSYCTDLTC